MSPSFYILCTEVAYHHLYHILFVRNESQRPTHPQKKGKWAIAPKGRSINAFVDILVKPPHGLGILKLDMNLFHVFHRWETPGPVKSDLYRHTDIWDRATISWLGITL